MQATQNGIINYSVMAAVYGVYALWELLARAAAKGKLLQAGGRRIWLQFFLSILALTFWGEGAEAALDAHFGGLPVALYLKYGCLIGASQLYLEMLRETGSYPAERTGLDVLGPAALSLGLLSFVGYAILKPIPFADLRFTVIGARDGVVATFMIFGFLRPTLAMGQAERVPAMRFKQTAILLFFLSFILTSLGAVTAAIMTIIQVGDPQVPARVLQPVIYPTIVFFILMLVPYRWFSGLLYLPQWLTYRRLQRLERRIHPVNSVVSNTYRPAVNWLEPGSVELGIYHTVIALLDASALLVGTGVPSPLAHAIQDCVRESSEYADLVQALARLDR